MQNQNLIPARAWYLDQQEPQYWGKFHASPIGRAAAAERDPNKGTCIVSETVIVVWNDNKKEQAES